MEAFSANASKAIGRNGECKSCKSEYDKSYRTKNPERVREQRKQFRKDNSDRLKEKHKRWYADNKVLVRRRVKEKTYGIPWSEVELMLDNQDGCCAICGDEFGDNVPQIDHCHVTGKVRGLLCRSCNTSLGGFKDDVNNLHAAIAYLED